MANTTAARSRYPVTCSREPVPGPEPVEPAAPVGCTASTALAARVRAVGANTYIHSLLEICGLVNVCASSSDRYPRLGLEELEALSPDLVLLSSEPFPFDESHVEELARRLRRTHVMLVDGEMFGWYGSRMRLAAEYLAGWVAGLRRPLG